MPQHSRVALNPRKTPVQARSTASVTAILDATVQVLLSEGKSRLTTTRVALRAGVSVGTLYQYFPNKSAMLQATLKRHIDQVHEAVDRVCLEQRGNTLQQMATALIQAFLAAKMRNPKASVAMYSVSSDVDGAKIAKFLDIRSNKAIAKMLASSCEPIGKNPQLVASILMGALGGVSRRLLESGAPEKEIDSVRQELILFVSSYLNACSARER